jgi:hypothetical protein
VLSGGFFTEYLLLRPLPFHRPGELSDFFRYVNALFKKERYTEEKEQES